MELWNVRFMKVLKWNQWSRIIALFYCHRVHGVYGVTAPQVYRFQDALSPSLFGKCDCMWCPAAPAEEWGPPQLSALHLVQRHSWWGPLQLSVSAESSVTPNCHERSRCQGLCEDAVVRMRGGMQHYSFLTYKVMQPGMNRGIDAWCSRPWKTKRLVKTVKEVTQSPSPPTRLPECTRGRRTGPPLWPSSPVFSFFHVRPS